MESMFQTILRIALITDVVYTQNALEQNLTLIFFSLCHCKDSVSFKHHTVMMWNAHKARITLRNRSKWGEYIPHSILSLPNYGKISQKNWLKFTIKHCFLNLSFCKHSPINLSYFCCPSPCINLHYFGISLMVYWNTGHICAEDVFSVMTFFEYKSSSENGA